MAKAKTNQAFFQSPENARSRALLKGMGYTTRDLKQPRIGVANSWGETSPGHFHLRALAAIAQIAQPLHFYKRWTRAKSKEALRDTVLLGKRLRN